jgi:hypothetical protein
LPAGGGKINMGLFKGLAELAILPFDLAADFITLGGVCVGRDETFTGKRLRRAFKKFDEQELKK